MSEEKKKVTTEMLLSKKEQLQDLLATIRSERQARFDAMMEEMGDLIPGDGKTLRDES
jgi:DNA-binding protein H-NS